MGGIPSDIKADRRARVKSLTAQGLTASEIADQLKVSERTVVRYRRATGCSQPVPRHLTADVVARAGEMLDDGCPYEEVARTLRVSPRSVAAWYPGRAWAPSQVSAFGNLHKRFHA